MPRPNTAPSSQSSLLASCRANWANNRAHEQQWAETLLLFRLCISSLNDAGDKKSMKKHEKKKRFLKDYLGNYENMHQISLQCIQIKNYNLTV